MGLCSMVSNLFSCVMLTLCCLFRFVSFSFVEFCVFFLFFFHCFFFETKCHPFCSHFLLSYRWERIPFFFLKTFNCYYGCFQSYSFVFFYIVWSGPSAQPFPILISFWKLKQELPWNSKAVLLLSPPLPFIFMCVSFEIYEGDAELFYGYVILNFFFYNLSSEISAYLVYMAVS